MSQDWDAEFRPRRVPRIAVIGAALFAVAGIVIAVLNNRAAGANWRGVDQVAIGGLAVIIAAAVVYLATRPRLRVGPAGLAVRNVLDERVIPWSEVAGIAVAPGKRWARVEVQAYEYIPVLAIQVADRDYAVGAMDTVRAALARYRPRPE